MQHQFMQRQMMPPRPQQLPLSFQQPLSRHPQQLHRRLQHPRHPHPQFQQQPHYAPRLQRIQHPQHRQHPQQRAHPQHPQHPRPHHPRQFQQPQLVQQRMLPKPPRTTVQAFQPHTAKIIPPKPEVKKPPPTAEDRVDLFVYRPGLGKSFSVDDVSLEAPKTFADAKKVHSSILDKKVVYNPTLPKNRDEALQKIKEQLIKRLNSTLKLKLHWTCTRPLGQSEIPIPVPASLRQKRKKLSTNSKRGRLRKSKRIKSEGLTSTVANNAETDVPPPLPAQWVQCDNIYCRKWRKMSPGAGPLKGKWYCVMNTWNPREASCSMPQSESDQS